MNKFTIKILFYSALYRKKQINGVEYYKKPLYFNFLTSYDDRPMEYIINFTKKFKTLQFSFILTTKRFRRNFFYIGSLKMLKYFKMKDIGEWQFFFSYRWILQKFIKRFQGNAKQPSLSITQAILKIFKFSIKRLLIPETNKILQNQGLKQKIQKNIKLFLVLIRLTRHTHIIGSRLLKDFLISDLFIYEKLSFGQVKLKKKARIKKKIRKKIAFQMRRMRSSSIP